MIVTLLKDVFGIFSGWLSNRQKLAFEKQKTKIVIEQNKQRLAKDRQQYNHEWEMANLADKDRLLRWTSFIMFSAPFVVAIFAPDHIQVYFQHSLKDIPSFWKDTFIAINGGIWGLSSLKNVVPGVIGAFRKGK